MLWEVDKKQNIHPPKKKAIPYKSVMYGVRTL